MIESRKDKVYSLIKLFKTFTPQQWERAGIILWGTKNKEWYDAYFYSIAAIQRNGFNDFVPSMQEAKKSITDHRWDSIREVALNTARNARMPNEMIGSSEVLSLRGLRVNDVVKNQNPDLMSSWTKSFSYFWDFLMQNGDKKGHTPAWIYAITNIKYLSENPQIIIDHFSRISLAEELKQNPYFGVEWFSGWLSRWVESWTVAYDEAEKYGYESPGAVATDITREVCCAASVEEGLYASFGSAWDPSWFVNVAVVGVFAHDLIPSEKFDTLWAPMKTFGINIKTMRMGA